MHQAMAAALDEITTEMRRIQDDARVGGSTERPRWPMIVLRTPKGWTGPAEVDGVPVEGTFRAHQVPLAKLAENPEHLRALEEWMRVLPARGAVRRARPPAAGGRRGRPRGRAPHGRQPARQRRPAAARPAAARLPRLRRRRAGARNAVRARPRGCSAAGCATSSAQSRDLPRLRAGRDRLEPARRRHRGERPRLDGRTAARRRARLPRRPRHGSALRASVPGLAGGLPADRPARPVQLLRGVHPHRRLDVQPARQVAEDHPPASRGGGRSPR